mgnify:CR=1 FL=1
MPANFTSGWLGNGERAWHGMGVVTDGTLPAREAFERADALFEVEKRPLYYLSTELDGMPTEHFAVVRKGSQACLGIVSKQYELVQNEALLRMAEFVREEADMDSVVVLADGAKVAFTATLRGAEADIVAGDKVKRRLVGYLGHDGKTGCGAKFTDIRVVCQNTLAAALNDNGAHSSIRHKSGANANFDALIQSINTARQSFDEQCELMREFTRVSMGSSAFDEFVDSVYDIKEGDTFRKRDKLRSAFHRGLGADFAPLSLWNGVNAITQIETSTRNQTRAGEKRQFARANFGAGLQLSRKAMQVAELMLTTC